MTETNSQLTLVTGASGFIGRWLIKRLLADGERVRALVLPNEDVRGVWPEVVEVLRGSITERTEVGQAVQGADTVYHLAAMVGDWGDELKYQHVTVGGTWNVLQAVAPSARVVLASSIVVYGHLIGQAVCDEDLSFGRPQGMYSRAKQAQEKLAWQVAAERNLQLSIVRPANVFGVGSRPWVEALLKDLPKPRSLPAGLARAAATACEAAWRVLHLPDRPPVTHEAVNLTSAHHGIPNARAREELGYAPRVNYVTALQTLARAIK